MSILQANRMLDVFHKSDSVVEVRIIGIPGRGRSHTASGYFNDFTLAAAVAAKFDAEKKPEGIYFVLNEVDPQLFARSPNTITEYPKHTTADQDIKRRRCLLVDIDPKRPAGIGSTEAQFEAARAASEDVWDWLAKQDWPEPILAMSGNGYHLLYPIDLPNDDESRLLVVNVLKVLAAKFDSEQVSIDQSVFNAARITKFYGTTGRKGHETPSTPHRQSRLVSVPDYLERGAAATREVVPLKRLQAVASMVPQPKHKAESKQQANGNHRLDVPSWLQSRNISFRVKDRPTADGRTVFLLDECPFNSDHGKNGEVCIMQAESGKLSASCKHNSCRGNGWQQFKQAIGEPAPGDYDPPFTQRTGQVLQPIRVDIMLDIRQPEGRTDIANARRLVKKFGHKIRFCREWGKWLVYDDKRWLDDGRGNLATMAKSISDDLWRLARQSFDGSALRFAAKSAGSQGVNAMISLAESEPSIQVSSAHLDKDPWLFNCDNGTLHLQQGELRPHKPTDLITKLSTVKYDPDASAPVWCKFLDRTFACRERLIKYIQRLIGYALTGMVNEQILLILWGGGSNGKSTLLSAVLDMLGPDYSMQAVSDLLMSSRNDKHPTERADLFGKRFVSCVETEGNRSLAESLVKQLTGGEKVRARRMREDFWEFDPTHKIVLATNHKPRIKGTDHAIWRRVRLIPFPVKFWDPDKGETGPVELRQDKFLSDKLRAELPGILRWAVEGSRDWQQNGLKAPAEVLAATDEYRDSQDVLTAFIEDRCVTGEQFTTQAGPLYQAYREWAEQNGEELMSNRRFGECLTERGFDGEKKTYVFRRGIALKSDSSDSQTNFGH